MIDLPDQLGRRIKLEAYPKRIISLVPSQTELLHDLGMDNEVVGITKFCIHPQTWFKTKTRIGGTKKINFEKIKALYPDLIIGNKEENDEQQIKQLAEQYVVWMSDIRNLADAVNMIKSVGQLIGKEQEATNMATTINKKLKTAIRKPGSGLSVAYIIWKNPFMVAAADTFVNDMLYHCGLINAFSHLSRYPLISEQQLKDARPDLLFLSTEPYPFKDHDIDEFKIICSSSKAMLVDGEMFSWYGSRLIKAADYFNSLLLQMQNAY